MESSIARMAATRRTVRFLKIASSTWPLSRDQLSVDLFTVFSSFHGAMALFFFPFSSWCGHFTRTRCGDTCIDWRWVCDQEWDCPDGSDETLRCSDPNTNPPKMDSLECMLPLGESFQCKSGDCIEVSLFP